MRHFRKLLILSAFAAVVLAISFFATAQEPQKQNDNWLLDAKDDTERYLLIQKMVGGFSTAMQVVGQRYELTYHAIDRNNFDLANYHWKKIKEAIELGYLRRPARKENAVNLFLKGPWISAGEGIISKEEDKAKERFLTARLGCMACHLAEKVPFMNDQLIFLETAGFPVR